VGVRRWRHWHYADDFDHPLIFTKRLEAELFLVFANKTRPALFFETSGTRMSERIRTSTVIMSWNSRRQDGQREAGESPLIFFAGIFPSPGPETVLFLCGPTPTMNALEEIIRGLSYPEESVFLP
jgi:hypothetical protein